MAQERTLDTVEKKELESQEEQTAPGKFYVPYTDIHETETELVVTMEMPGVDKSHLEIELDNDVLSIEGRIDFKDYEGWTPLYTEYNVGHFRRSFKISRDVDREAIAAKTENGVLTLHLPKAKEQAPRRIEIQ